MPAPPAVTTRPFSTPAVESAKFCITGAPATEMFACAFRYPVAEAEMVYEPRPTEANVYRPKLSVVAIWPRRLTWALASGCPSFRRVTTPVTAAVEVADDPSENVFAVAFPLVIVTEPAAELYPGALT